MQVRAILLGASLLLPALVPAQATAPARHRIGNDAMILDGSAITLFRRRFALRFDSC